MIGFISKLFGGNKSEKDIKLVMPLIKIINEHFESFQNITNDELRNKTVEFRQRIKNHLSEIDTSIADLNKQADELPFNDLIGKDNLYKEVDKLKIKRDKNIEEILKELLPEAFAVVKETCRRFKENQELESTATQMDKDLSVKRDYVNIEGDKAIYKNTWTAAGGKISWNMVHYDVQLIGGIVLHEGKIAEMATGEGKTLVSTLPSYLNALAGEGVHLITVNEYLARRDQEWNGTIFEWLGLTVDCIDKHQPNSEERRKAYYADITYGTNNEFGFDYLRDNMVHSPEEMVQRKHHFTMVDEVDSVLIDDARTPLIISGPIPKGDEQQYHILKPRIHQLVEAQEKIVRHCLTEAKKLFAESKDDPAEGGLFLYRAFRGLPKYNPLIKFLSEPGIKVKLQKAENYYIADQNRNMHIIDSELLFHIDEKNNSVDFTDLGNQTVTQGEEDPDFFVLPDISIKLSEIEEMDISADEKLQQKEQLLTEYTLKADRIHSAQQLLKAYTLFEKEVEYVVMDSSVKIVDEQTGRILDGRRYSDGLHQAIEAKENVKIEAATQTYATITLQNYFRMYHKLAGMTGTAETEAAELWSIYKLDVTTIPTNIPIVRKDDEDLVYKTKREKYKAIIDEIEKLRSEGRPVLVGTTTVEVSELLGRMLTVKKIPHSVLNAKQHAKEAQIVAEAGLAGSITIATNMAGRGTDIKLGPGVKEAGGLAIIGTERHESRRVDRQLRGRAGRQGDPGSSLFYISLEDDLMRMFGSERIASFMDKFGYKEGEMIQHGMISKSIERAQKKVEENNFGIRKRLLEYDDVMNKQRTTVYEKRHHALFGERLALDVDNAFSVVVDGLIYSFREQEDFEGFKMACIVNFGMDISLSQEEFFKSDFNSIADKLYQDVTENYEAKKENLKKQSIPVFKNIKLTQGNQIENVVVPFTDGRKGYNVLANMHKTLETNGTELCNALERSVTLAVIDDAWKEHLRSMDDLKQSVQTAYLEQKDPLVIYKMEAFNLFKQMDSSVNRDIVSFLCHAAIPIEQNNAPLKEGRQQKTDMSRLQANKDEYAGGAGQGNDYHDPSSVAVKHEPVTVAPKIGRNEPCPCGSGKKYKQCHGKDE